MPEGFFNSAAAGYSNVQQQLQAIGGLRGSFAPNDGMGAAYQVSTPPAPRFNTYTSTAAFPVTPIGSPPAPLPSYGTAFNTGGGGQGYTPSAPRFPTPVMPPMFSYGPPPIPYGSMPTSQAYPSYGMASMMSDIAVGGGFSTPGIGASIHRTQSEARRRLASGAFDTLGTIGNVASWGFGLAGMALGGVGGLGLGVLGAGLGIAHGAYTNVRAQTASTRELFSNITSGGLLSPSGYGINNATAMQINAAISNSAKGMGFGGDTSIRHGLLTSTMQQAQEMGMLKGSTGSVGQIVSRVTELAKVTEGIMALGESITQGDAMQLQAMTQQMGISTQKFKQLRIGDKLVSAARLAGTTIDVAMQAAGQGASTFTQLGLNAGQGMTTGAYSMGAAASLVGSGYLSPSQLAKLGGESGIQQQILGGQAAYRARRAQEMLFGGLGFSANGFYIEDDLVEGNIAGFRTGKEMRQRGIDFFNDKRLSKKQRAKLRALYDEQAEGLSERVQENISELDIVSMQSQDIINLMNKRGMSRMQAATSVLGSKEAATVFLAQADSGTAVGDQIRQRQVNETEVATRTLSQYNSSRVGYVSRALSDTYNQITKYPRALGQRAAEASLRYEDALEAGQRRMSTYANLSNLASLGDNRERILAGALHVKDGDIRSRSLARIADLGAVDLLNLVGGSEAYKGYYGSGDVLEIASQYRSRARDFRKDALGLARGVDIRRAASELGDDPASQGGALYDIISAFQTQRGATGTQTELNRTIGTIVNSTASSIPLDVIADQHAGGGNFFGPKAKLRDAGSLALRKNLSSFIANMPEEKRKQVFGSTDVEGILNSAAGARLQALVLARYKSRAEAIGHGGLVTAALGAEDSLAAAALGQAATYSTDKLSDASLDDIDQLKSVGFRPEDMELLKSFAINGSQPLDANQRNRLAFLQKAAASKNVNLQGIYNRAVNAETTDEFGGWLKGQNTKSTNELEDLFQSHKLGKMFAYGTANLGIGSVGAANISEVLRAGYSTDEGKGRIAALNKKMTAASGLYMSSDDIAKDVFGIDISKLDAKSADQLLGSIANFKRKNTDSNFKEMQNQIYKVMKTAAQTGSGATSDEYGAQAAADALVEARKIELKAMQDLTKEMANLLAQVTVKKEEVIASKGGAFSFTTSGPGG